MTTDPPTATDAVEATGASRSRSARDRWAAFARRFPRGPAMLVLTALVLLMNVSTVFVADRVSPIDEQYWINHLISGGDFHVVTAGERLDEETLRELCARDSFLFDWPDCPEGHIDDGSPWAYKGVDIAGHSPFYFFVSGPIARVLRATPIDLPPNDSMVTWGRLLGSAWLLLGFYFTLRAGDLLGVGRRLLVVALTLLAATPALFHMSTIINPDQTALPSGAAVLLAGLSWERRGRGLWLLVLAALVGVALDDTNAVAILLVLLYLGLRVVQRRHDEIPDRGPGLRSYAIAVVLVLAAAYLANKGWSQLNKWLHEADIIKPRSRLADISDNPVRREVTKEKPTLNRTFRGETVLSMFPPWSSDSYVPPIINNALYSASHAIAKLFTIAVLGIALFASVLRRPLIALAIATVVTLLVSPSLIVLNDWREGGTFLAPAARYGLSAMPAIAILLAAVGERLRFAGLLMAVVAGGLYVATLLSVAI